MPLHEFRVSSRRRACRITGERRVVELSLTVLGVGQIAVGLGKIRLLDAVPVEKVKIGPRRAFLDPAERQDAEIVAGRGKFAG